MAKNKFPVAEIQKALTAQFDGYQVKQQKQSNNSIPYLVIKGSDCFYVKVIDTRSQEEEGLDEVASLKSVSSKYVIELIDSAPIQDTYHWLQFPQILGDTLDRVKTTWDSGELTKLALHIAYAVNDMWRAGVVHRDIKPKNIIKQKNGEYLLLDLGIGYFIDQEDRDTTKARGSRFYSAPEQFMAINGKDIDISFATDHFSLGVILYELATGTNPFQNFPKTYTSVGEAICQYDPEPPIGLNKDISPEISAIIMRLLNKSPSKRFASPQLLIDALKSEKKEVSARPRFYLHAPNSLTDYLAYHDASAEDKRLDGVLVSITASEKKIKEIKTRGLGLLIDPETYKLPYPKTSQTSIRAKLKIPAAKSLMGLGLADNDFLKKLTRQTIELQEAADRFVPPYFAIRSVEDGLLEINKKCWRYARDITKEKGITKPILGGIMLSRDIVVNVTLRTELLDKLIGCSQLLDGYYITFQNEDDSVHSIIEQDFLDGIKEIVTLLGTLGEIVIGRADLSIVPLVPDGTFVTSNEKSARSFSFTKKLDNPKPQEGAPKEEDIKLRYYADPLYDFLEEKATLGILADLGFETDLSCDCQYCQKAKPFDKATAKSLIDSERHFYVKITDLRQATSGLKNSEWVAYFNKRLATAIELSKRIAKSYPGRERFAQYEGLVTVINK